MELRNEGNTVIFYSWKKLPRQLSLSHLYQQKDRVRYYFRSSSGTHTQTRWNTCYCCLRVMYLPMCQPLSRYQHSAFCIFLCFYFHFNSGVIHPRETQQVEFIFKSEEQGLWTEIWQLNTNPVLLQGASIQIRLSGVAIKLDKTADQRSFLKVT